MRIEARVEKRQLTGNERAATFIGWRPSTCKGFYFDYTRVCGKCGAVHRATDMSDPRNYMKALQGLPHLWFIANHRDGSIQIKIWDEGLLVNLPARCCSVGKFAVEALAALYDAEKIAR